jgi:hypothetical protein
VPPPVTIVVEQDVVPTTNAIRRFPAPTAESRVISEELVLPLTCTKAIGGAAVGLGDAERDFEMLGLTDFEIEAEGLFEIEGLIEALGADGDKETERETEAEGEREAEIEALGAERDAEIEREIEADGIEGDKEMLAEGVRETEADLLKDIEAEIETLGDFEMEALGLKDGLIDGDGDGDGEAEMLGEREPETLELTE